MKTAKQNLISIIAPFSLVVFAIAAVVFQSGSTDVRTENTDAQQQDRALSDTGSAPQNTDYKKAVESQQENEEVFYASSGGLF